MDNSSPKNVRFGRAAPGICVCDIEATCSFYSKVLGFTKIFANGTSTGFVVLKKDDAEIHLIKRDHHATTANVAPHLR